MKSRYQCALRFRALLRSGIDVDEAERRAVAELPFEAVEQRPDEVPADVDAVGECGAERRRRATGPGKDYTR
jgi:hypothetical protein